MLVIGRAQEVSKASGDDERAVRELTALLDDMLQGVRSRLTKDRLQQALEARGGALFSAMEWGEEWEQVAGDVEDAIVGAMQRAGEQALKQAGLDMSFTVDNPYARHLAKQQVAELAVGLRERTYEGIREIVERGFVEGISPKQMAAQMRALKPAIGLTKQQAGSLRNQQAGWAKDGYTPEQITDLSEKLGKRMLKQRTDNIARTETIDTQNAGTSASWKEAQSRGLLLPQTKKRWIAAAVSDRTCPICRGLHGQTVDLDADFVHPGGPGKMAKYEGKRFKRPGAHPSCRCRQVLVTEIPGETTPVHTTPLADEDRLLPSKATRGIGKPMPLPKPKGTPA